MREHARRVRRHRAGERAVHHEHAHDVQRVHGRHRVAGVHHALTRRECVRDVRALLARRVRAEEREHRAAESGAAPRRAHARAAALDVAQERREPCGGHAARLGAREERARGRLVARVDRAECAAVPDREQPLDEERVRRVRGVRRALHERGEERGGLAHRAPRVREDALRGRWRGVIFLIAVRALRRGGREHGAHDAPDAAHRLEHARVGAEHAEHRERAVERVVRGRRGEAARLGERHERIEAREVRGDELRAAAAQRAVHLHEARAAVRLGVVRRRDECVRGAHEMRGDALRRVEAGQRRARAHAHEEERGHVLHVRVRAVRREVAQVAHERRGRAHRVERKVARVRPARLGERADRVRKRAVVDGRAGRLRLECEQEHRERQRRARVRRARVHRMHDEAHERAAQVLVRVVQRTSLPPPRRVRTHAQAHEQLDEQRDAVFARDRARQHEALREELTHHRALGRAQRRRGRLGVDGERERGDLDARHRARDARAHQGQRDSEAARLAAAAQRALLAHLARAEDREQRAHARIARRAAEARDERGEEVVVEVRAVVVEQRADEARKQVVDGALVAVHERGGERREPRVLRLPLRMRRARECDREAAAHADRALARLHAGDERGEVRAHVVRERARAVPREQDIREHKRARRIAPRVRAQLAHEVLWRPRVPVHEVPQIEVRVQERTHARDGRRVAERERARGACGDEVDERRVGERRGVQPRAMLQLGGGVAPAPPAVDRRGHRRAGERAVRRVRPHEHVERGAQLGAKRVLRLLAAAGHRGKWEGVSWCRG